jgi:hypothetical protein
MGAAYQVCQILAIHQKAGNLVNIFTENKVKW